jgi:hypothetical protein
MERSGLDYEVSDEVYELWKCHNDIMKQLATCHKYETQRKANDQHRNGGHYKPL